MNALAFVDPEEIRQIRAGDFRCIFEGAVEV